VIGLHDNYSSAYVWLVSCFAVYKFSLLRI
jgi:hypothetical protein